MITQTMSETTPYNMNDQTNLTEADIAAMLEKRLEETIRRNPATFIMLQRYSEYLKSIKPGTDVAEVKDDALAEVMDEIDMNLYNKEKKDLTKSKLASRVGYKKGTFITDTDLLASIVKNGGQVEIKAQETRNLGAETVQVVECKIFFVANTV